MCREPTICNAEVRSEKSSLNGCTDEFECHGILTQCSLTQTLLSYSSLG